MILKSRTYRLVIGLFGLVGIFGIAMAPIIGRTIDRLIPWFAAVLATLGLLVFQSVQTGAGGVHIAAVIIACFGIDVFGDMQQVSLTHAVFGLDPNARSRLNAVLIISVRFPSLYQISGLRSNMFFLDIRWSDYRHCRRYYRVCTIWMASRCSSLSWFHGIYYPCFTRKGTSLFALHVVRMGRWI